MAEKKKTKSGAETPEKTGRSVAMSKLRKMPRRFMGNNTLMLAVKGAVVVAALFSLLMLAVVGADLRPSAVIQGAKNKYAFTHATGDGFPVDIPGGKILGVSEVTKGTAVLTSTKCTIYDGKGREVTTATHSLSSPAMKSAGGYILLFHSMGEDYILRTLSGVACKGKVENSIICADVSNAGVFAFVTTSDTNNARLLVCSPDGKIIHKWKSVDYKIADVAISPSGEYIALCGYSAKDGVLVSTVIIQQVGRRENLKEFDFKETLIADIQFDGNSRVVSVGDNLAAYVSVKNEDNTLYDYNGRTLNCYDLSRNGDLALVFSDHSDGRNSSVIVINDDCVEKAHIETAMTSPYVDLEGGRINLLYQSGVSSYNYKGRLLNESDVQADCQSIFTSGGSLLARGVMYLSEIG